MIYPDNRIHINFSSERASDGTVIRSTIMVNIHEEEISTAVALYRELRSQLENSSIADSNKNETKVETFTEWPMCPSHHVKMLLRTKRSSGDMFYGCPLYSSSGCKTTMPYPVPPKENVGMSSA